MPFTCEPCGGRASAHRRIAAAAGDAPELTIVDASRSRDDVEREVRAWIEGVLDCPDGRLQDM